MQNRVVNYYAITSQLKPAAVYWTYQTVWNMSQLLHKMGRYSSDAKLVNSKFCLFPQSPINAEIKSGQIYYSYQSWNLAMLLGTHKPHKANATDL